MRNEEHLHDILLKISHAQNLGFFGISPKQLVGYLEITYQKKVLRVLSENEFYSLKIENPTLAHLMKKLVPETSTVNNQKNNEGVKPALFAQAEEIAQRFKKRITLETGQKCYNIVTNIFLADDVYQAFVTTINQACQMCKNDQEITVQHIIRALEKQTGKDAMELINLI